MRSSEKKCGKQMAKANNDLVTMRKMTTRTTKWEKKADRVTKQRNLTSDDPVNWQLWRLKTSN
jgi:hypothetical protein